MTKKPQLRAFSHVAMCVSDMNRSLRFYCDVLGFERRETYDFHNEPRHLMEIDAELRFTSQFLKLDGMRLELFCFESPATIDPGPRSPMHTLGFTHLAVRVGDLEEAMQCVIAYGGQILESTRTKMSMPGYDCEMVYCLDPDGRRIELLWMPQHIQLS